MIIDNRYISFLFNTNNVIEPLLKICLTYCCKCTKIVFLHFSSVPEALLGYLAEKLYIFRSGLPSKNIRCFPALLGVSHLQYYFLLELVYIRVPSYIQCT